MFVYFIYWLFI